MCHCTMVGNKLVSPLAEPTDRVCSVLAAPKKDVLICIRLDPYNQTFIPSVEDILFCFYKSNRF